MGQFLNDEIKQQLKDEFAKFDKNIEVLYFTKKIDCDLCEPTEGLLNEITELTDKISFKIFNFVNDKEEVEKYAIEMTPAIVIKSIDKDYGIRFYGIPAGYEFTSLFESLRLISLEDADYDTETIEEIKKIDKPVKIKVFVTPSCPYCPGAVINAHRMAFLNENITAEMIEASEFQNLSVKYQVQGVPRTIINDDWFIEGAVPETMLLDKIKEAIQ